VYALHPATGEVVCRFETKGDTGKILATPAVGPDDTPYVATEKRLAFAIGPDGSYRWTGQDLPLEAGVLVMAGTLDVMRSDRPYRPPRSLKDAGEEIPRCSGTQSDPDVVATFLTVAQRRDGTFLGNSAAAVDRSV